MEVPRGERREILREPFVGRDTQHLLGEPRLAFGRGRWRLSGAGPGGGRGSTTGNREALSRLKMGSLSRYSGLIRKGSATRDRSRSDC